jgi:hypothetical protein
MPADDTSSLDPAPERPRDRAAVTSLYTVTVTSPGTGRVQTVQVPAPSARSAFPIACAWYPLLPLTGADVQVAAVEPAPPAPAARNAA